MNNFQYKGSKWSKAGAYVLTFDGDGNGLVLDKLNSEYAFNLVTAPWEKDADKLAAQYKEVVQDPSKSDHDGLATSEDGDGLFDDNDEPDPSNPFDYRHYLKSSLKKSEEIQSSSTKATPALFSTKASTTTKPPNTTARPQIARTAQPRPRPAQALRAPPPRVRLERRASEKRSSPAASASPVAADEGDDVDGLVIDMGDGYQPRKKQKSMLLTPQAPGRPISLRSAAASASPAASVLGAALPEPGSGYEEDDEEVEGEEDEDEDEEDDEVFRDAAEPQVDEDVEELDLGASAVVSAGPYEGTRRQSTWDASTEADLQAELERALGADDDDDDGEEEEAEAEVMQHSVAQESEEESEEE